jgi:hypothetical protein
MKQSFENLTKHYYIHNFTLHYEDFILTVLATYSNALVVCIILIVIAAAMAGIFNASKSLTAFLGCF